MIGQIWGYGKTLIKSFAVGIVEAGKPENLGKTLSSAVVGGALIKGGQVGYSKLTNRSAPATGPGVPDHSDLSVVPNFSEADLDVMHS